jgi:hypothetical protein
LVKDGRRRTARLAVASIGDKITRMDQTDIAQVALLRHGLAWWLVSMCWQAVGS